MTYFFMAVACTKVNILVPTDNTHVYAQKHFIFVKLLAT